MTKEEFFKKKCLRFENQRTQHTGSFSHTRSNGYNWQMFVCPILLEPFNPYAKENKGREYKVFYSFFSSSDCKKKSVGVHNKSFNQRSHNNLNHQS